MFIKSFVIQECLDILAGNKTKYLRKKGIFFSVEVVELFITALLKLRGPDLLIL